MRVSGRDQASADAGKQVRPEEFRRLGSQSLVLGAFLPFHTRLPRAAKLLLPDLPRLPGRALFGRTRPGSPEGLSCNQSKQTPSRARRAKKPKVRAERFPGRPQVRGCSPGRAQRSAGAQRKGAAQAEQPEQAKTNQSSQSLADIWPPGPSPIREFTASRAVPGTIVVPQHIYPF